MATPRIVVVGGGAGGLELVTRLGHKLGRRKQAEIVLVDRNPTHIWKPLLHEVATGVLDSGLDEAAVDRTARDLGRAGPTGDGVTVLGPAPAPFALLRGRHRRRLLLKTAKETNLQAVLRDWLGRVKVARKVRVQTDVDPYSFL